MGKSFWSPVVVSGVIAVLLGAAISGFFYAWVCSTMWGLDATDPRTAIQAMQAMNESVRNAVFFPAFFLTPVAMALTGFFAWRSGASLATWLLVGAAVLYLVGGIGLTGLVNVPMNNDLAQVVVPQDVEAARAVWQDYSSTWQSYNLTRTVVSFVSLALATKGLLLAVRAEAQPASAPTAAPMPAVSPA